MAKLSARQANELANYFLGMAQAIGDFRYQHWGKLTRSQNQRLGKIQWSVLHDGESMLATSTTLVLEEAAEALKQMEKVSISIRANLKSLKDIRKGIRIAALVVELGTAILTQDAKKLAKVIEKSGGTIE